jgi:1,4-dihydroxy-2-naphthoyl-CoA hydrolase
VPALGQRTTTAGSSIQFIARARLGSTVTGEAIALHRGHTTQAWHATIRNAGGKLCAVVAQTQLILGGG